ncbi:hypothetical protein AAFN47_20815 [Hoeflea sp. CAU 1731]
MKTLEQQAWIDAPVGHVYAALSTAKGVRDRRVAIKSIRAPDDGTAAADWMTRIPAQTILDFRHSGWADDAAYAAFCNRAWGACPGESQIGMRTKLTARGPLASGDNTSHLARAVK